MIVNFFLQVRRKTLNLGVELVTGRSVGEMVEVLKKEVGKTHNTGEHEDTGKYRQLLVRTLHAISMKFPEVAATIIPVLMEFLSDTNELAATDVLVSEEGTLAEHFRGRAVIVFMNLV